MPALAGISAYNRKREPGSPFPKKVPTGFIRISIQMYKDENPRMNKDGNTHKYVCTTSALRAYHALTCKHICSYSLYNAEI